MNNLHVLNFYKKRKAISRAEAIICTLIIVIFIFLVFPSSTNTIRNGLFNAQKKEFQLNVRSAIYSMMLDDELNQFYNTESFLRKFQYYIPISTICNEKDLISCFPRYFTDGENNYYTENLISTSKLGLNPSFDEDVYGVVFQNGVSALVSYQSDCKIPPKSQQHEVMDCIILIYDINSINEPNELNVDIGGINAGGKISGKREQVGTVSLKKN